MKTGTKLLNQAVTIELNYNKMILKFCLTKIAQYQVLKHQSLKTLRKMNNCEEVKIKGTKASGVRRQLLLKCSNVCDLKKTRREN